MQLSPYQQEVIDQVEFNLAYIADHQEPINLIIKALAGSGKSTMLLLIGQLLAESGMQPDEAAVLVFGKKNQLDLQSKFKTKIGNGWDESVRTLHSLCYGIYRDALGVPHKLVRMESWKYSKIAEDSGWLSNRDFEGRLTQDKENPCIKEEKDFLTLLDLLRLYCYDATVENVIELNKRHRLGVMDSRTVATAAAECLAKGKVSARVNYNIDQTDMVWIPWVCRDEPKFRSAIASKREQLKFIAIDEAQDTDQLQVEVISMLLANHNFLVAVGDTFQSCYLFRGCMNNGLEVMQERFNAQLLDLPVNYRCGAVHLDLVRAVYPEIQIQPHDNAPKGEVRCVAYGSDFLSCFEDMSLSYLLTSRKNAPMTVAAIRLLADGKPVVIKDKSLGNRLKNLIKQVTTGRGRYSADKFPAMLDAYSRERAMVLRSFPDHETRLADHYDMCDALLALFEAYAPASTKAWEGVVDSIFQESGYSPISFYTIHSGKGGEGDCAFMLFPEEMPLIWRGQSDEEYEQEEHLCYVAMTRSLATSKPGSGILYLVLRGEDGKVAYPSWLPQEYRKLWKPEGSAVAVV